MEPLWDELGRWVEPRDALRRLAGPGAFLLEAGRGGRWSYLAPPQQAPVVELDGSLDAALRRARELLDSLPDARSLDGLPPFRGGLVGSLGYDLARRLERLPDLTRDDLSLPPLHLRGVRLLVAFDQRQRRVLLTAPTLPALRATAAALYESRRAEPPPAPPPAVLACPPFAPYRRRLEELLRAIADGEVYQVNYTHRLEAACDDPVATYARLSLQAPVPFGIYLDAGRFALVGASPERFLRVDADGTVETEPMKGTRPRGATPLEDAGQALELLASAKDRAENVMIADLARNDLGRVCAPGSIVATDVCRLERHPTVHQLVSTVRGRLRPGFDALDAALAAFPPGSMTGAPKVRAMQLIEQSEVVRRGPYAGAFGWFGADGSCDLAVVIRTAVVTGGRAYLHVGGGIVADSDPRAEYDESLLKAATVARALGAALPGGQLATARVANWPLAAFSPPAR